MVREIKEEKRKEIEERNRYLETVFEKKSRRKIRDMQKKWYKEKGRKSVHNWKRKKQVIRRTTGTERRKERTRKKKKSRKTSRTRKTEKLKKRRKTQAVKKKDLDIEGVTETERKKCTQIFKRETHGRREGEKWKKRPLRTMRE